MSEPETYFRRAYDALLDEMPDPPTYEAIGSRALRIARPKRAAWVAAVSGLVLVLVLVGGVALLVRGYGWMRGPTTEPHATPDPTMLERQPANGTDETEGSNNDVGGREVACSPAGAIRFSPSLLHGPELGRDELAATPIGEALKSFFVVGQGVGESQVFLAADGFTVVSESLVLGYRGDLPDSYFRLDGDRVVGWGTCALTWVWGDLVAYRWELSGQVDANAMEVPVQVMGGGCVSNDGVDVLSEVAGVDVLEREGLVEVTVWVRSLPYSGFCRGVGLIIEHVVTLTEPLAGRALWDSGAIPRSAVETPSSGTD